MRYPPSLPSISLVQRCGKTKEPVQLFPNLWMSFPWTRSFWDCSSEEVPHLWDYSYTLIVVASCCNALCNFLVQYFNHAPPAGLSAQLQRFWIARKSHRHPSKRCPGLEANSGHVTSRFFGIARNSLSASTVFWRLCGGIVHADSGQGPWTCSVPIKVPQFLPSDFAVVKSLKILKEKINTNQI